jgi:TRAP-type C4-dicarboxylate transport system permease small subunit
MPLYGLISRLARWLAMIGGVSLILVTLMTVVSITGRAFIWAGLRPVPGDFELVELGTAIAVFSFLPWCQLNRGHATVDVFTSFLSERANRVIDLVTEIVMTLVMLLFAWRLWHGMLDKIRYNETTFILQYPIWWGYAAAMVALVVGVIVSVFVVYIRVRELVENRTIVQGQGVVH